MSEYRDEIERWILNQATPPITVRPALLAAIELGVRLGLEAAAKELDNFATSPTEGLLVAQLSAGARAREIRAIEPAAVLRKPIR